MSCIVCQENLPVTDDITPSQSKNGHNKSQFKIIVFLF
jgi:hypothetical protein